MRYRRSKPLIATIVFTSPRCPLECQLRDRAQGFKLHLNGKRTAEGKLPQLSKFTHAVGRSARQFDSVKPNSPTPNPISCAEHAPRVKLLLPMVVPPLPTQVSASGAPSSTSILIPILEPVLK